MSRAQQSKTAVSIVAHIAARFQPEDLAAVIVVSDGADNGALGEAPAVDEAPPAAVAVARRVATGDVWRGILIDGAGIGSCMAANKIAGIRAAMCYDQATAVNSREHNNANVLALGAGLIGPNLAQQIVKSWLATEFGGGRHAARVAKIDALDGGRPAVAQGVSSASAAVKSPPAY